MPFSRHWPAGCRGTWPSIVCSVNVAMPAGSGHDRNVSDPDFLDRGDERALRRTIACRCVQTDVCSRNRNDAGSPGGVIRTAPLDEVEDASLSVGQHIIRMNEKSRSASSNNSWRDDRIVEIMRQDPGPSLNQLSGHKSYLIELLGPPAKVSKPKYRSQARRFVRQDRPPGLSDFLEFISAVAH